MGAPTRGGAATEAEREKNQLTRGLEGYFKDLEFYYLLTHLTMMCHQRVLSTSCLTLFQAPSYFSKTKYKNPCLEGLTVLVIWAKAATKDFWAGS